jgi:hypothetical protein
MEPGPGTEGEVSLRRTTARRLVKMSGANLHDAISCFCRKVYTPEQND